MFNDILGSIVRLLVLVSVDFFGVIRDLLEKLSGESGRVWFDELKWFLCKKPCWLSNLLRVDRSTKFDPTKFPGLGAGWSIEEEDENSLALTEIDLTQVLLEHMLHEGETHIKGEEKLKRLKKTGCIRLDARVFQTLWENQSKIPKSWKELVNGNTKFIYFDGTILRGPGGGHFVLCLCWLAGEWHWRAYWLGLGWLRRRPSAVLAK